MKIHITIPYRLDKDLGKAYNEAMQLIGEDDWACFLDYDVLMLTPDAPAILYGYAERFPEAMLICNTNRIHPSSPQLLGGRVNENADLRWHIQKAEELKSKLYQVKKVDKNVSGLLMLISKRMWRRWKFDETGTALGVDTAYWKKVVKGGGAILRMEGLYVWHTYRLMTGIHDKSHLVK